MKTDVLTKTDVLANAASAGPAAAPDREGFAAGDSSAGMEPGLLWVTLHRSVLEVGTAAGRMRVTAGRLGAWLVEPVDAGAGIDLGGQVEVRPGPAVVSLEDLVLLVRTAVDLARPAVAAR